MSQLRRREDEDAYELKLNPYPQRAAAPSPAFQSPIDSLGRPLACRRQSCRGREGDLAGASHHDEVVIWNSEQVVKEMGFHFEIQSAHQTDIAFRTPDVESRIERVDEPDCEALLGKVHIVEGNDSAIRLEQSLQSHKK